MGTKVIDPAPKGGGFRGALLVNGGGVMICCEKRPQGGILHNRTAMNAKDCTNVLEAGETCRSSVIF